ncbi:MAG: M28 family peptidase [Planctomycetales bacterium]|nr:M28 family peptidase [Planctomycetales bacterium]
MQNAYSDRNSYRARSAVNWTLRIVLGICCAGQILVAQEPLAELEADVVETNPALATELQSKLLSEVRQLTFDGLRTGEGYFSTDGTQLVFQSEREPGNPFFQIYLMELETGDVRRISPGIGKTTCAWIHPDGKRVLFASTQFDPEAKDKQQAEYDKRNNPEKRSRYSWDYDETYELVEFDLATNEYHKLTQDVGYDAEGSYSPDGSLICFASNRRAYTGELSAVEKLSFEENASSAMELYLMNADGTNVRRLTHTPGYDGGPFFSPDGKMICWRRFDTTGAVAEIMVMNADGTEQRQLTNMKAISWAPYFHPSGDYLIFATNRHGFGNFELYMIATHGNSKPVRVTYRAGFDGLPAFSPDGQRLVWTSNGGSSQSQLYESQWNDAIARELLGLSASSSIESEAQVAAAQSLKETGAGFAAADVGRHVDYLCRPELGGRLTGSAGEKLATAYVAAYLESLGMQPVMPDGSFFHEFEFISDVSLGAQNSLRAGEQTYKVNEDWRPLFFSQEGEIEPSEVVFAGYGMRVPESEGEAEFDCYVHLDVKDKWVMVFRGLPQDVTPERRQHLIRFASERYKAMIARDLGARGIVFVSGPTSQVRSQLVPLRMDGTLGTSSLAVLSIHDRVADEWLQRAGKSLLELQQACDTGEPTMGFTLADVKVGAQIDIEPVKSRGRNVLAMLSARGGAIASEDTQPTEDMIVIGAHIDHLGTGQGGGSLAKDDEIGGTHRGADDNASGVACMLEIAQYLSSQVRSGNLNANRDMLFAAWSGEELGLRGSQAFAEEFEDIFANRLQTIMANLHAHAGSPSESPHLANAAGFQQETEIQKEAAGAEHNAANVHAQITNSSRSLAPWVVANLNLDMVGRLRDNLVLQGIGSSAYWNGVIERRNAVARLSLTLQDDCHLPTDASTFFLHGVPILSAFTGSHEEYHTPRDVPELLNYEGAANVAQLMALIARDLVMADEPPEYRDQPAQPQRSANLIAYLGTVPDYAGADIVGVKLSGVTKGAPAEKAGLKAGDIIVELAGRKIENIYDYTYAIEALKVGQETSIAVTRGDTRIELQVTPASRD